MSSKNPTSTLSNGTSWNPTLRIVWATDPFESAPEIRKGAFALLQRLAKDAAIQVEPVYLLGPTQMAVHAEHLDTWSQKMRPGVERALQAMTQGAELGDQMLAPRILIQPSSSLSASTRALSDHAAHSKSDLILVSSHARAGIQRAILGSFAETLLLHSKVPVLVARSQESSSHGNQKNVLFPTDFCERSHAAFHRAVSWAKRSGSKLTLFHGMPRPIEPVFQSGVSLLGGFWVPIPESMREEESRSRKIAADWAAEAKSQGVTIDTQIQSADSGVVGSVLDYSRNHDIGLIMMAGQSGPVVTALIGSIARKIVREAPCPVLIMH